MKLNMIEWKVQNYFSINLCFPEVNIHLPLQELQNLVPISDVLEATLVVSVEVIKLGSTYFIFKVTSI